jgi:hypothetical protein
MTLIVRVDPEHDDLDIEEIEGAVDAAEINGLVQVAFEDGTRRSMRGTLLGARGRHNLYVQNTHRETVEKVASDFSFLLPDETVVADGRRFEGCAVRRTQAVA